MVKTATETGRKQLIDHLLKKKVTLYRVKAKGDHYFVVLPVARTSEGLPKRYQGTPIQYSNWIAERNKMAAEIDQEWPNYEDLDCSTNRELVWYARLQEANQRIEKLEAQLKDKS